MNKLQLSTPLRINARARHLYYEWFRKHLFKVLIATLLLQLILVKDVTISLQLKTKEALTATKTALISTPTSYYKPLFLPKEAQKETKTTTVPKAQSFYNLTFILSPDYAARKGIPLHIVQKKQAIVQQYLATYKATALSEQAKYGIPASITLAQGLLESNAGDSRVARQSNNHFGIKCRAKCKGCTCKNYADDDYYDMFRVFETPWESYREHSILLSYDRYKHLNNYGKDYKKWAHGLKKAGYATDKKYAEKLITIIDALKLYEYDL